jgi:hypothetical protein
MNNQLTDIEFALLQYMISTNGAQKPFNAEDQHNILANYYASQGYLNYDRSQTITLSPDQVNAIWNNHISQNLGTPQLPPTQYYNNTQATRVVSPNSNNAIGSYNPNTQQNHTQYQHLPQPAIKPPDNKKKEITVLFLSLLITSGLIGAAVSFGGPTIKSLLGKSSTSAPVETGKEATIPGDETIETTPKESSEKVVEKQTPTTPIQSEVVQEVKPKETIRKRKRLPIQDYEVKTPLPNGNIPHIPPGVTIPQPTPTPTLSPEVKPTTSPTPPPIVVETEPTPTPKPEVTIPVPYPIPKVTISPFPIVSGTLLQDLSRRERNRIKKINKKLEEAGREIINIPDLNNPEQIETPSAVTEPQKQ